ncbi:MAG: S8 family serine peptidase [Chloroflexota bacterium]
MVSWSWRGAGVRARSSAGALALALALLFNGVTQSVPIAAADSVGEMVVQPAPGKTLADVNRKFGTVTEIDFDGSEQALVKSNTYNLTYAAMQADARSAAPTVAWVEPNYAADDPRAQEDSGSDCPKSMPASQAETMSQEDSGSDGQSCAKIIPITGLLGLPNQYAVNRIQLDDAQRLGRGAGQVVAVLDTEVDALHPMFLLHIRAGLDLATSSLVSTLLPPKGNARGHGTFVAGIVRRAAPDATILPVTVLSSDGRGSTAQVAAGIHWAVNHGATVINMSLDTPTDTRVLRDAVQYALSKNVAVVAAYGNEGKSQPAVYPADYPGVISVMATDKNDRRASFSNYGRPGVVAAPGVNIISAYSGLGLFGIGSGTSFSAPWVAGEAALIRARSPGLSPSQVLTQIQATSDDVSASNGGARTVRVNGLRGIKNQTR